MNGEYTRHGLPESPTTNVLTCVWHGFHWTAVLNIGNYANLSKGGRLARHMHFSKHVRQNVIRSTIPQNENVSEFHGLEVLDRFQPSSQETFLHDIQTAVTPKS